MNGNVLVSDGDREDGWGGKRKNRSHVRWDSADGALYTDGINNHLQK
jgi:hypothetical protein